MISLFFFFTFLFWCGPFFFLIYLFWLCWVFVSVRGLSLVAVSGGARASHRRGLSCWEHRLQTCRHSSCGSRAQLLRSMWDLHRPGLETVSPALAGRFSTTVPPGKPRCGPFLKFFIEFLQYCFCFMFSFFGCEACGILAPRTGMETGTPCIGRWSVNHWTAREVPPPSSLWEIPLIHILSHCQKCLSSVLLILFSSFPLTLVWVGEHSAAPSMCPVGLVGKNLRLSWQASFLSLHNEWLQYKQQISSGSGASSAEFNNVLD